MVLEQVSKSRSKLQGQDAAAQVWVLGLVFRF